MEKELITALTYVAAAYGVTWAIIFVYLVFIGRKARKVEKEVKNLKEILESKS